jgi:hypothetical protein
MQQFSLEILFAAQQKPKNKKACKLITGFLIYNTIW